MTTLAQQLQKLAVPQTSLLQRDKKRASLLFDPKEAAGIDRDTFFDIGISGLKELIKLNVEFATFENSLFSITSRQIERAVENQETNVKLNKNIRKFLLLLSPYFLLKPSHKALEWLIHRFSIHDYNKDDVMKLILPYHETNIFVKFLQILNIRNENDKWHWLRDLQKAGVHLPKLTLFNHAAGNTGFLQFVGEMTLQAMKENGGRANSLTTLFSFYCVCTIGALEQSPVLTEQQISTILPTLLKGLSSNIIDFTASTYMITAKLLLKCRPSTKILNQLVLKLTSSKCTLHSEAAMLLVLIYQSQEESYTMFPERALNNLITADWFITALTKLSTGGTYTLPLIIPIFKALLEGIEQDTYRKFFDRLISELPFDDESAEKVIVSILDNSPNMETLDRRSAEWCSELLKRMEQRYPNPFDKVVKHVVSGQSSDKQRQTLSVYLNIIMSVSYKQNNVFEKLYHPNANFRENAVAFFVKNYPNLNEKERNIFKNAIEDRLVDDNRGVIKTVLTLKRKYLVQLLGTDKFIDLLTRLLNKCHSRSWYDIAMTVITLLCSVKVNCNTKIFLAILPFILPTNINELMVALHIIKTEYANDCAVLRCVKRKVPQEITPESFCDSIYSALCEDNNLPDISLLIDALENVADKDAVYKYLSVVLITCGVPRVCHPALGVEILNNIFKFIDTGIMKVCKIKDVTSPKFNEWIISAKNGEIPLQGILVCIDILVEKVIEIDLDNSWFNFISPNESLTFVKKVVIFLLNGCSNKKEAHYYSESLRKFFQKYFPSFKAKIEFFANLLVIDCFDDFKFPLITQLRAVRALNSLLESDESISWSLDLNSRIFVPSVLISLANPTLEIRTLAVEILCKITNSVKLRTEDTYLPLLQELVTRKEEILLDSEQISLILFAIFDASNKIYKPVFEVLFDIAGDFKTEVHIISKLLKILTFVNSYDILESLSNVAVRTLEYIGNQEQTIDRHRSEIIYNILLRINDTVSSNITLNSSTFNLLSKVLRYDIVCLEYTRGKYACPAVLALDQISRELFTNMNFDVQSTLIKQFCEIFTSIENPEVVSVINKVVKRIDLDGKLLVDGLSAMRDAKSSKADNPTRKRRTTLIPTIDILDTKEWIQGVALLEFIQDKKKITNTHLLLPYLFTILKKCLDFDEQASVEYPKQLILSSILHCCVKLEGKSIPESSFNMELVVQCVRASQNPQTHHHALLLLAHTASLIPTQVLHNIMAIFTFMGSSVLRHDDAYSFQIISKIIDSVIPVLVQVKSQQEVEVKKTVSGVLRVFVDVILDVPEHRRIRLFIKLLTTLGVDDYLWIFLLLVFESHILHGNEKQKNKNEKVFPRLHAATQITEEFKLDAIIKTNIKLLEFLKKMPEEKGECTDADFVILNLRSYTPKQFRHYKYTLVTFLSGLLTSKQFVNKVAVMNDKDTLQMEGLYKNTIIHILTYIQTVTKISESNVGSPQAQYWKVMLHHCYDILDSINALLTKEMFLLVVRGLVVHNILAVRRKALELLNAKLQHQASFFYANPTDEEITETDDLFALLPSLIEIIKSINKDDADCEIELIQQTALLTLKLLIRLLADKNADKFIPLLEFMSDLVKTDKVQGHLLASMILCLAELVSFLRAHAIPSLVKFMPALIRVLKQQKHQEAPNLLLMCVITALQKIVDSLPLFLSPYLEKLLFEISVITCRWNDTENLHKSAHSPVNLMTKLTGIRSGIGNKIPPRVLIPIIGHTYDSLAKTKQYNAIGPLMDVLSENLINVRGQELIALLPELTTFFLTALEFRNVNQNISIDQVNVVESQVIKCLTVLILKLSESTFRPFYYRLYDWAVRCETKNERIITFYNLSAKIAENLKSLFVLFAGHFIKNAATVLDECNSFKTNNLYFESESKCLSLMESVIKTLSVVFTYDGQSFVDKDRFEVLMQPLVDQLENRLDFTNLPVRCQDLIIPCIAQFAVSTADDTLWKQLNYQILLKTRHELPVVRLQGLHCVSAVAAKIGEDFLPLLPETIPFLAELLEDEDENVESSCQTVVRELEAVLGEPLQKYF